MITTAYEHALQMATSLSHDDQLRLIRELMTHTADDQPTSVLDLYGLGAEVWQNVDAQEYVHRERDSWSG